MKKSHRLIAPAKMKVLCTFSMVSSGYCQHSVSSISGC